MGRRVAPGKHFEWSERIRRRRESGLTVTEFCEWESVSIASFYNWQKKLQGAKSPRQSVELVTPEGRSPLSLQSAPFLTVHVLQAGATASTATGIEIQLTNGVRDFVPISDFESVKYAIKVASGLSAVNDNVMNQDSPSAEDATCCGVRRLFRFTFVRSPWISARTLMESPV